MRVLITGATGLIGQELVKLLHEDGVAVNYLTTRKHKIVKKTDYNGFYWNPKNNDIDIQCLKDVDAIINLVGATVAKRWTSDYKKEILESRTKSLDVLYQALQNNEHQVSQLISASAIGIYEHSLTNYYEEDSKALNTSFLGDVVKQWEEAADTFESLGIRVCKIRIGLVLSDSGGALPQIVKPIKYGFGAAFGSGKQWQSWIHIEDLVELIKYILDKKLKGVFNAVSPNPTTNSDLVKTAAKVLGRPLILPNIPKIFLRLILGKMHVVLFTSNRISSRKIENLGFNFRYHHLKPALEDLLT